MNEKTWLRKEFKKWNFPLGCGGQRGSFLNLNLNIDIFSCIISQKTLTKIKENLLAVTYVNIYTLIHLKIEAPSLKMIPTKLIVSQTRLQRIDLHE